MRKLVMLSILIAFGLVFTMYSNDVGAVTIYQYNFSNSSLIYAEEISVTSGSCNDEPPPDNYYDPIGCTWSSITSENSLDFSDNNYSSNSAGGTNEEPSQIFYANISSIDINTITLINWTWEGNGDSTPTNIYFYLWNTSNEPTQCNYASSTTDITKNCTSKGLTQPQFINSSGYVNFKTYPDTVLITGGTINTDFVKLEITTDDTPTTTTPTIAVNTTQPYAYGIDKLNCTSTATDDLNTTPNVEFSWYNDTNELLYIENKSCTSGDACGSSWLDAGNFSHFQNITCSIKVYDGISSSSYYNATKMYINNSLPTNPSNVIINDTSITDVEDIKCNYTASTDNDAEDTITYHYNWYKNSTAQNYDFFQLGAGNTTSGDVWQCEVWAFDSYGNSSKILSGSIGIDSAISAPVISSVNSTYNNINTSSNPVKNHTSTNLALTFIDANAESWTAHFCKGTGFTVGGLCTQGSYCSSPANLTGKDLNCTYSVSGTTSPTLNYYAFVVDSEGYISSQYPGTIYITHPPDLAYNLKPSNLSTTGANSTQFNWSTNDLDSDIVNSTLYLSNSTDNLWWLAYNGTSTSKTIDNLLDGIKYFWRVYTIDEYNTSNGLNTSTYERIVDYSPPNITSQELSSSSITSGNSVVIYANVTDFNSTISSVSVYVNDSAGVATSYSMSLVDGTNVGGQETRWGKTLTPGLTGNWIVESYTTTDSVGNSLSFDSTLTFSVATSIQPSGGGSTKVIYGVAQKVECEDFIIEPSELEFKYGINVLELKLTNKKTETINPILEIKAIEGKTRNNVADLISIRGGGSISPTDSISISIIKNMEVNGTDYANLAVSSEKCTEVIIPITLRSEKEEFFGYDFFKSLMEEGIINKLKSWIKTPIIVISKEPYFAVYNWWIVILSSMICFSIFFLAKGWKFRDIIVKTTVFFITMPIMTAIISFFIGIFKR